jgi:hypothetical protein
MCFGSLVTSRVSGDRLAKLNRHAFHGVFLGYTAPDLNVRYYNHTSGRIKTARHDVFDGTHYKSKTRAHPVRPWYSVEDATDPGPSSRPRQLARPPPRCHPWRHNLRYPCPSQHPRTVERDLIQLKRVDTAVNMSDNTIAARAESEMLKSFGMRRFRMLFVGFITSTLLLDSIRTSARHRGHKLGGRPQESSR